MLVKEQTTMITEGEVSKGQLKRINAIEDILKEHGISVEKFIDHGGLHEELQLRMPNGQVLHIVANGSKVDGGFITMGYK